MHAQQHLGPAAEPAGLESESDGLAGAEGGVVQGTLRRIDARPEGIAAAQVQGTGAGITGRLEAGAGMIAQQGPASQPGFKVDRKSTRLNSRSHSFISYAVF